MLFAASIPLGILIGWAFKGKIQRLATPGFKGLWLAVAAFAIQWAYKFIAAHYGPYYNIYGWQWLQVLVTYGMILAFCALNYRLWAGAGLFAAGTLMNLLVIAVNRWNMPISRQALERAGKSDMSLTGQLAVGYFIERGDAKLLWLGDVIALAQGLISVGDIVLIAGMATLVAMRMCTQEKLPRHEATRKRAGRANHDDTPAQ